MTEPIEIRSGGNLLFMLTPQGQVEFFRDGWLHTVDIPATLTAGTPCVTRRYVGKRKGEHLFTKPNEILTNVDTCAMITHKN